MIFIVKFTDKDSGELIKISDLKLQESQDK